MKSTILFALVLVLIASPVLSDTVVTSFQGSGGKNTRPFTVQKGWEIQWDSNGDIFQLYLYTADGNLEGVPANQQGAGKGSSYQAKGGKYYLQVNALGAWKINIVQVGSAKKKEEVKSPAEKAKESKPSNIIAEFSGSGGKNTRPFQPNGSWEIQWNAKGDIFQLYLYSSDGNLIGVPANQMGAGVGSSYQPKGGKYYLQVNAMGDWTIKIVRVE